MVKVLAFLAYLLSHGQATPAMATDHFVLQSDAFHNMGHIPAIYTCKGQNESVPLHWKDVPKNSKSLVLVMSDPDAPGTRWYHWGIYNISPDQTRINANLHDLPYGATPVRNSWGAPKYQGPCPPTGHHRYEFKLYALDERTSLPANSTIPSLKHAMRHHVMAMTKLTGIF